MGDFSLTEILNYIQFSVVLRVFVLLVIGIPSLHFLAKVVSNQAKKRYSEQAGMVVNKSLFYLGLCLIIFTVFKELGFNLTALMGTAGVIGIAVGFASQTSLSNVISGLFLIGEKPFSVGDLIRIGERLGVVVSIDFLSVKLRTLDNLYVRIPNENLIKQEVVNITRYPIRRMNLDVNVAYKEDVSNVMNLLKEVARKNPFCLDEPEPLLLFKNFGDSSLEILFGVWFVKTDFVKLKNSIMMEIKECFDKEGIEIPFPHRTIYSGSKTDAFPIKIHDEGKEQKD
ncbi:MAG: mechanosensitive ion channel family protein [Fibrobacteria bacterium]|nr:mechanosensitive ion channel family protein [Fibrobacteria bacterium]